MTEYDALPGLGNEAVAEKTPRKDGNTSGHGCGHNLIGAGAVVTPGTRIEARTLALGTPARSVRTLGDDELRMQRERTLSYVETARAHAGSRELAMTDGTVSSRRVES